MSATQRFYNFTPREQETVSAALHQYFIAKAQLDGIIEGVKAARELPPEMSLGADGKGLAVGVQAQTEPGGPK